MRKIFNVPVTIKNISKKLKAIHQDFMDADFDSEEYYNFTYTGEVNTEDRGIEIRLQVVDGSYHVLSGDPQYDTNNKGFWGCAYLPIRPANEDIKNTASELIDSAYEDYSETILGICHRLNN
mgnify:FL=1